MCSLSALGITTLATGSAQPAAVELGVDYYPEQWALVDMKTDMQSIKSDLKADVIRVGEFMW